MTTPRRFISRPSRASRASRTRWLIPSSIALAVFGALGLAAGCSSSETSGPTGSNNGSCTAGSTLACTCANGTAGSKQCGDTTCTSCAAAPGSDAGTGTGAGDGGHTNDGAPPSQLYADAAPGSFGWPCAIQGPDPTDCTDPSYNVCFIGGQGSWCTHYCDSGAQCGDPPTTGQCNKQGYCK